jgi:biopolymer transport protein ExbB/TolQ
MRRHQAAITRSIQTLRKAFDLSTGARYTFRVSTSPSALALMNAPFHLFAQSQTLPFVWQNAPIEGKIILGLLLVFSIFAWSVMASKAMQMRRAKRLNSYFEAEFRHQPGVLSIYDRRLNVEGCPLFTVYQEGCMELDGRLKHAEGRHRRVSLKTMEHIKRTLERAVAQESLKLESGLILLAIAVSGAPFLGLLGTVWGVMITFADVGQHGRADLTIMAPGVAAALVTTVAGLLVAIPSMFGYNWLVHNLRVLTVQLDNFAQEFVSKVEVEYLKDDPVE